MKLTEWTVLFRVFRVFRSSRSRMVARYLTFTLETYMALPASELTADLTADRCALPAARLGSRSEPFSRSMSFCLYASRSGTNKKSPVSVDWHYMTLCNHCQKAS
ncbi:hypothetical protein EYF80_045705 [Liparis tanakae]|uniref:Uncharacterized protein n=1 Tax=Liparis tanakae TaxID=230148 RepID=A0A4Z2FSA1_9TELE|nr:hypothetical protein EYF80_045705 [Liparis tanakae]